MPLCRTCSAPIDSGEFCLGHYALKSVGKIAALTAKDLKESFVANHHKARCRTCNCLIPPDKEFCQPHGEEYEARWDALRGALRCAHIHWDHLKQACITCGGKYEDLYPGVEHGIKLVPHELHIDSPARILRRCVRRPAMPNFKIPTATDAEQMER